MKRLRPKPRARRRKTAFEKDCAGGGSAKESIGVPRAVENTLDANPVGLRTIVDHVVANREHPQARNQFVP